MLQIRWRRVELNHRPRAYESLALPLSYGARIRSQNYSELPLWCQANQSKPK